MAIETIPLPADRIEVADNFEVTVRDLTAWPDQKLRVVFTFNSNMDRYMWEAYHVGEGQIIRRNVAVLGHSQSHWPFCTFQFVVPGGDAGDVRGITPDTLGDPVKLAVFPGPLGGQFLQDNGLTAAEERELLTFGDISRTQ